MANMRVHELAKELNITSKDITDMLSNSEKTYKSVSGLTDAEISSVRKNTNPYDEYYCTYNRVLHSNLLSFFACV